jgi:hydrogenase maturation protein HypF
MAENEIAPPALGVSWDGTGYGTDGTIWGGEFFLVTNENVERVAHLRPFRLPGGDKAVKEPRRTALGLLYEMLATPVFEMSMAPPVAAFSPVELATLKTMLASAGLNSPVTSSMGRLFDAVASLINLRQQMRFEGQAAMELEFALDGVETDEAYELATRHSNPHRHASRVLDWSPMVERFYRTCKSGVPVASFPPSFTTRWRKAWLPLPNMPAKTAWCLSGGCFQNRYLTERTVRRLRGGFSAVLASARAAERRRHCAGTSRCCGARQRSK